MANNHLMSGVETTPETSCISDVLQTMNDVQHSVSIMGKACLSMFYP
jgi:hypothetical protein